MRLCCFGMNLTDRINQANAEALPRTVSLARRPSAFASTVAESFLLRPRVFGRSFLTFHAVETACVDQKTSCTVVRNRLMNSLAPHCFGRWTRRFPYPTSRNLGVVAGETHRDERGGHRSFFATGCRASDEIEFPRSLRPDLVEWPSWDGREVAMRSMPAFHGDLDAGPPRRGQCTTRQTGFSR
jgi:hypothetical protein